MEPIFDKTPFVFPAPTANAQTDANITDNDTISDDEHSDAAAAQSLLPMTDAMEQDVKPKISFPALTLLHQEESVPTTDLDLVVEDIDDPACYEPTAIPKQPANQHDEKQQQQQQQQQQQTQQDKLPQAAPPLVNLPQPIGPEILGPSVLGATLERRANSLKTQNSIHNSARSSSPGIGDFAEDEVAFSSDMTAKKRRPHRGVVLPMFHEPVLTPQVRNVENFFENPYNPLGNCFPFFFSFLRNDLLFFGEIDPACADLHFWTFFFWIFRTLKRINPAEPQASSTHSQRSCHVPAKWPKNSSRGSNVSFSRATSLDPRMQRQLQSQFKRMG
jgi:hypothetical protein